MLSTEGHFIYKTSDSLTTCKYWHFKTHIFCIFSRFLQEGFDQKNLEQKICTAINIYLTSKARTLINGILIRGTSHFPYSLLKNKIENKGPFWWLSNSFKCNFKKKLFDLWKHLVVHSKPKSAEQHRLIIWRQLWCTEFHGRGKRWPPPIVHIEQLWIQTLCDGRHLRFRFINTIQLPENRTSKTPFYYTIILPISWKAEI